MRETDYTNEEVTESDFKVFAAQLCVSQTELAANFSQRIFTCHQQDIKLTNN